MNFQGARPVIRAEAQRAEAALLAVIMKGVMPLGLYIAVPFCRSKCSFCNFASDVFAPHLRHEYVRLLRREIELAVSADALQGAVVDSIYWGGGTPTLLDPEDLTAIVHDFKSHFQIACDVEHTVEAAPGTLSDAVLDALQAMGVNRVSLGVQSFQDEETRAVARLHRRATTLEDFRRLRAHGFENFSADLIAGLPHQTAASWAESLQILADEGVPHASVYMLEIDDESRLGTELLAGGERYHAHHVPDDDQIAAFYETACQVLPAHGLEQYEISNFARSGRRSRHNERYWLRQPYLGFGVDAHSMLSGDAAGQPAVRFANHDRMEAWMSALREGELPRTTRRELSRQEEWEETLFLGLRRNQGLEIESLRAGFGDDAVAALAPVFNDLQALGLLEVSGPLRLTDRGRMLSNEVFTRLIGNDAALAR